MKKKLQDLALRSRTSAEILRTLSAEEKNKALSIMARELENQKENILLANAKDMEAGGKAHLKESLLDRLMLDDRRLRGMADALRDLAKLEDPIFATEEVINHPKGMKISKVREPLGVIAIIYEARPNVTADAAGICLKTSNSVILRGGKEAFHSNRALVQAMRAALNKVGLPEDAVLMVEDTSRESAEELMTLKGYVDLLIPRGGAGLIRTVVERSTVPVIETGTGNCHLYVDETAPLDMALDIAINGKVQRPGVCNALETLLVHRSVAEEFLAALAKAVPQVELRGCPRAALLLPGMKAAAEEDFEKEFLDLILAVKVVDSLEEAIRHINHYGTGHSETIVTANYFHGKEFQRKVDAAAVYVNASTRFTDGGEFGFGAEIGISTQKFHARGPMGLKELTTWKYVIDGQGQIR